MSQAASASVVTNELPCSVPLSHDISDKAFKILGFHPCQWQLDLCRIVLSKEHKVMISTAAMGAGKSVTFWLPLLFETGYIIFIVVPLKDLGQQLADQAASYGFSSINVT
jgi:superfamily II DNA helicase RecQ